MAGAVSFVTIARARTVAAVKVVVIEWWTAIDAKVSSIYNTTKSQQNINQGFLFCSIKWKQSFSIHGD